MCGIAGIYGTENFDINQNLKLMLSVATHRGPDDQGIYSEHYFGIGLNRLSIIDLDTGHQPISSSDNRFHLVCNGEIYNYIDLKEEILKKGYKFKTKSDVEVIIPLFLHYGIDGFKKLDGMFAFALVDSKYKKIYLCRDRYGIKPLYYYIRNDGMIFFASEIKSILKINADVKKNHEVIYKYLIDGFNDSIYSAWSGIKQLEPGHYLSICQNKKINEPYHFDQPIDLYDNENEAKKDLREAIINDIESQLMSDVPIGVFLSGGIDSSIILGVVSEILDKKLPSFSIDFNNQNFSESYKFKKVAKMFNTEHHVYKVDTNLIENINDVLMGCDEPFGDMAALPTYLLCLNSSKKIKVALSGDGADEIMYGYNYNNSTYIKDRFYENRYIHELVKLIPLNYPLVYSLLHHTKEKNGKPKNLYQIISNKILNGENFEEKTYSSINEYDFKSYLPNNILYKTDRMSMLCSLETRVPFLGNKTVNVAKRIPKEFQVKNDRQKILLVDAFKDILKEKKIMEQKKHGLSVPVGEWIKKKYKCGEFISMIKDSEFSNIINFNVISKIVNEHYFNQYNHGRFLYRLYITSKWYNKF